MSQHRSIHKRKIKKIYGYIFLSVGIFCVVLSLCMSGFLLLQRQHAIVSPLAAFGISTSHRSNALQEIQNLCSRDNLSCSQIQKQGDTITFNVNSSVVYISATKDIQKQLDSLQLTIRQLTMEGKEFHRLDFRYDRPVISN